MSSIPHDIIFHILTRTPATSLLRFKAVSKLWYATISLPSFIKTHLSLAIENDSSDIFLVSHPCLHRKPLYCISGADSFNDSVRIANPLARFADACQILGACNGILCLSVRNVICLLNPATKEYKIVKFRKKFWVNLRNVYGLGYDPRTQVYKLVEFVKFNKSGPRFSSFYCKVNVYSLDDTLSLTDFYIPYTFTVENRRRLGVYVNGGLHWIASRSDFSIVILCYDVGEGVCRELAPPIDVEEITLVTVGDLGGQLCTACWSCKSDVHVWVMKRYGDRGSWSKLFSFAENLLPIRYPPVMAFRFSGNGSVLLQAGYNDDIHQEEEYFEKEEDFEKEDVFETEGITLVLYDPKERGLTELDCPGHSWFQICNVVTHVASLVQLNSRAYAIGRKKKRQICLGSVNGAQLDYTRSCVANVDSAGTFVKLLQLRKRSDFKNRLTTLSEGYASMSRFSSVASWSFVLVICRA
ncbi:hypothetical protein IFM89_019472 [Coptis chinensis]|uniref:F-box domain-containing protein n=1 Tax=Coptis chinensis TaxID=261450 RepID=A0A835GX30_9MAGN|nr:hypothetical protein IFM89_019472 [Coptis chinensis]